MVNTLASVFRYLFDNQFKYEKAPNTDESIDWKRAWPFFALHIACLAVFFVPMSWTAIAVCLTSYSLRMFAITGFFHRYFSHKTFKTSRTVQFIFAILGTTATQRGPLWWAAHHRHHHRCADTDQDHHSPNHGFWTSHCGWFLSHKNFHFPRHLITDFSQYPELRWVDRFDNAIVFGFLTSLFVLGEILSIVNTSLNTSGLQLVVWGYCISTVLLLHATFAINSIGHRIGKRRYPTQDNSRNNSLLALLTFGEGWHNNHHHYAGSTRQGFKWWEIDVTYYVLTGMKKLGLVWDFRTVPAEKLAPSNEIIDRSEHSQ